MRQSERPIDENEERYRRLVETSPDGVVIHQDGRYLFANRKAAEMLGAREPADLIGRRLMDFIDPASRDLVRERLCRLEAAVGVLEPAELRVRRIDGSTIDVEVSSVPIHEGGKKAFLAVLRDITKRKQAEDALRRKEARLLAVVETAVDGVILIDRDGLVQSYNAACAALFGYAPEEVLGRNVKMLMPSPYQEEHAGYLAGDQATWERRIIGIGREVTGRRKDGSTFPLELSVGKAHCGDERVFVGIIRDISERKRVERALSESEQRYRGLVDASPDAIVIHQDGRCTFANPKAAELLGAAAPAELVGRPVMNFIHPASREVVRERLRRLAKDGVLERMELQFVRMDDSAVDAEVMTVAIREGGRPAVQSVMRDISERKRAEEHIRRLALHDALTGLPNRTFFKDRLEQALARARRDRSHIAVLLIDLDHFKDVNDTLGHPAGDRLLCEVAQRLGGVIRATDTLARLGGDEFVAVQTDLPAPDGADVLARKIIDAVDVPFEIDGQEVHIGTSIGISVFPEDGPDPDELLRHADLALYRAKGNGRNAFCFFVPAMNVEAQARKRLEHDLRRALKRDQLRLLYQPQVDLRSRRVTGVEALVRWQHPERGEILPSTFISVAETSGLILPLGRWVLYEACRQAKVWEDEGQSLVVAVNLSAAQVRHEELAELVLHALDAPGLPACRLELEITESVFMSPDRGIVDARLGAVAGLGVSLALDDFGTGYSSLAYLRRFPVDRIKIDRCFVAGIGEDAEDEAVVRAVIALGHSLGKEVVAEGVETAQQLTFLEAHGCEHAQGFLFGPPQVAAARAGWQYIPGLATPSWPAAGRTAAGGR